MFRRTADDSTFLIVGQTLTSPILVLLSWEGVQVAVYE